MLREDEGDSRIDGLINCVGMAHFCTYHKLPLSKIQHIHKTNIDSLHFMLQFLGRANSLLSSQPFFLNISSIAALYPSPYSSVYGATKAYLSNALIAISQEQPTTTFLNLQPHYVTTKMVGNLRDWDTASPQDIVEGSMRLLGKRSHGSGCIRHELVQEFMWIVGWATKRRFKDMVQRAERLEKARRREK